MLKYDILIPAFNAEETLPTLLSQIGQLQIKPEQVLVVDDGSSDETSKCAKDNNAKVEKSSINMGKGAALKKGFERLAIDSISEYILCMDADLQHPVSSIPDFINKAEMSNSKFLIGNRKKSIKNMPLHRIVSNLLTSLIISLFTRQKIKDSQCGYRLIHKEILKNMELNEMGFQLESEMILRASDMGHRIDFVQIPTVYNKENSNIRNFRDTFRFLALLARELLCILRIKKKK